VVDVVYASPRRTGSRLLALMLAVVFLTVIGSSVGYLVGRHVRDVRAGNSGPGPADTPSDTPSGKPCPDQTQHDAQALFKPQGALTQVLYVRTHGDGGASEVWICEDTIGNLYYQGHRLSQEEQDGAPREPFTDKNSLILQTVSKQGDDYVAENSSAKTGTTRYRVSTARLEIDLPDGTVQREQVVAHDP